MAAMRTVLLTLYTAATATTTRLFRRRSGPAVATFVTSTKYKHRCFFSRQCHVFISHHRGNTFAEEVISFLQYDNLQWRNFTSQELMPVIDSYIGRQHREPSLKAMLEGRSILSVGKGNAENASLLSTHQPFSFLLHLCPTPTFEPTSSLTEELVASHAWRNAHLTNAFASNRTIVHLHEDVWRRSPEIIKSRLRSKCGVHKKRIFARQTAVKRIHKLEYLEFLERNHLWGATSAKYAFGLYTKDEQLVAVATFSNKRRVKRASTVFHSYELLRFCTEMDAAVIGGLSKIISAFVKEVARPKVVEEGDGQSMIGIDLVTSIDRDFGTNSWPNFDCMDVMKPLPMFIGDDGIRRHAVGVGLTPLENNMDSTPNNTSLLLRMGLPLPLLNELHQYNQVETEQSCWDIARNYGFLPVFDAGVERLMLLIDDGRSNQLKPETLWNESTPRFVTDHYSKNYGVERMIQSLKARENSSDRRQE
ncbi:hypothetical protein ACHAXM_005916 [Skeletonema potamos]